MGNLKTFSLYACEIQLLLTEDDINGDVDQLWMWES